MIRLICQKGFKMSFYRNILLNDPSPFDILISDISKEGLKQEVSTILQIPYLSKYEGSMEELKEKVIFRGKIIGNNFRLFFSIPTARKNYKEYYYVHYLLDTGSPWTTLTHQALCCLSGKKAGDHNIHFTQGIYCSIGGGVPIQTHLSNPIPDEKEPTHNYHNVNLLGQNFLHSYKKCTIVQNSLEKEAVLELVKYI